jgi:hypothetical protein
MAAAGSSQALFDALVELGLGHAKVSPRMIASIPAAWLRARLL